MSVPGSDVDSVSPDDCESEPPELAELPTVADAELPVSVSPAISSADGDEHPKTRAPEMRSVAYRAVRVCIEE